MTMTLAPYEQRQYFDDDGDPLAFGKVYTYLSGTSTPVFTFSDSTGTQNTNPVVLDSAGRCRIYLDAIAYKFLLKDVNGVSVGNDMDPVTSTAASGDTGLGEVFDFGGDSAVAVTQTSYPSGATFDKLHQGTAVFAENSANLIGTFVLQATGLMVTSGTLTVAIVDLSSGAPDTPLATLTITSLTGEVATSGAITFGAAGITRNYGIKVKVSANSGYVWGVHLVRTS